MDRDGIGHGDEAPVADPGPDDRAGEGEPGAQSDIQPPVQRLDMIVVGPLVVEFNAPRSIVPLHEVRLISCLRLRGRSSARCSVRGYL
jgi:hypothetical protein